MSFCPQCSHTNRTYPEAYECSTCEVGSEEGRNETSGEPTGMADMESDFIDVHHHKFYFDDGNIVIASYVTESFRNQPRKNEDSEISEDDGNDSVEEDKGDFGLRRILFKVHKSVLASASKTFKDRFDRLEAIEVYDMYDGVPRIRVTDQPETIETVIEILYGKPYNITCFSEK